MEASRHMLVDISCNGTISVFAAAAIFGITAIDAAPANDYVGIGRFMPSARPVDRWAHQRSQKERASVPRGSDRQAGSAQFATFSNHGLGRTVAVGKAQSHTAATCLLTLLRLLAGASRHRQAHADILPVQPCGG